ncbi:MAG: carbohydrate ABC transporter permease [Caldilineaceae bacterium]|nr:carbohydrate ABC transporter permease [Caldilineaceae bacterium]MCB0144327.1 carbohydrate ABC transporter permease [Caldilineaceae bacterium]
MAEITENRRGANIHHAPDRQRQMQRMLGKAALNGLVIVVALVTFFPIYWMLVSTFQPNEYTLHFPPPLFPKEITVRQFAELFVNHPLALWLRNSFVIAILTMLICMILSIMGAYALSSLRWKGRNLFGLFLLVTQMLPEILVLIPIYGIFRRLDLLNSLTSLSVIDAAFILPICIWILKGVFDTVPPEVLDAAVVDGCTQLSVVWRIVLPLTGPGLVAVAVVAFFFAWNEYLYASIMLGQAQLMPASVGLSTLKAIGRTPVEQYMAAGLTFAILPVAFYLFMQRYIVSGLTAGAVKG